MREVGRAEREPVLGMSHQIMREYKYTTSVQLKISNRVYSKTAEKPTIFEVRIVIYIKN